MVSSSTNQIFHFILFTLYSQMVFSYSLWYMINFVIFKLTYLPGDLSVIVQLDMQEKCCKKKQPWLVFFPHSH